MIKLHNDIDDEHRATARQDWSKASVRALLWGGWIVASTLGWLLYHSRYGGFDWLVVGVLTGIGQWFIIRHYIQHAGWWIVVTAVGMTVAGIVGNILASAAEHLVPLLQTLHVQEADTAVTISNLRMVLGTAMFGLLLGGMQWLVVSRQWSKAGRWIIASTVGALLPILLLALVSLVGSGSIDLTEVDDLFGSIGPVTLMSASMGGLTGFVLLDSRPVAR
ncbi:MAG: hypothetical protein H0X37_02515 [Herpetosiphonaceae bacterium]|nr:hypothetical protein [Herpetosiphonaceae bacterium]